MTNTAEPKAAGKPGKVRKIIAKIGKKNIFLICAIFLIGGAVYLNWMLFSAATWLPTTSTTSPWTAADVCLDRSGGFV